HAVEERHRPRRRGRRRVRGTAQRRRVVGRRQDGRPSASGLGAARSGAGGKGAGSMTAVYPVPEGFDARIGPDKLAALHAEANSDPDAFWLEQARRLTWSKFPTQAGDWSFAEPNFGIRWYADGELNLSVNCLDRHLAGHGDDV